MGKPLLTDEIIEQAKRGQLHPTDYPYEAIDEEFDTEDLEQVDAWFDEEEESHHIYKSRRIENVKRQAFRSKLNMILLVLLLVLGVVMYAVFNW